MDQVHLKDRIAWAGNVLARRIGVEADAFRPAGPSDPLAPKHRFMRMHAAFAPPSGAFDRAGGHGDAMELGHFDTAYTRAGDYLTQGERVVFIATQAALGPALCVRTNRVVSVRRPGGAAGPGGSGYGGVVTANAVAILERWPASMLASGTGGSGLLGLPTDTAVAQWTILLPPSVPAAIQPGDIVVDAGGRQSIVASAELSHLGWRLLARQATS